MTTKDPLEKFEKYTKEIHDDFHKTNKQVFRKYPLLFSTLILFGVVSFTKRFELIVFKIDFLVQNPELLLLIGAVILLFTGKLYKAIQDK